MAIDPDMTLSQLTPKQKFVITALVLSALVAGPVAYIFRNGGKLIFTHGLELEAKRDSLGQRMAVDSALLAFLGEKRESYERLSMSEQIDSLIVMEASIRADREAARVLLLRLEGFGDLTEEGRRRVLNDVALHLNDHKALDSAIDWGVGVDEEALSGSMEDQGQLRSLVDLLRRRIVTDSTVHRVVLATLNTRVLDLTIEKRFADSLLAVKEAEHKTLKATYLALVEEVRLANEAAGRNRKVMITLGEFKPVIDGRGKEPYSARRMKALSFRFKFQHTDTADYSRETFDIDYTVPAGTVNPIPRSTSGTPDVWVIDDRVESHGHRFPPGKYVVTITPRSDRKSAQSFEFVAE